MLLAPGAFACKLIVTGIYKRLPFVAQEEKESYIKEFGARYLTYPSLSYQELSSCSITSYTGTVSIRHRTNRRVKEMKQSHPQVLMQADTCGNGVVKKKGVNTYIPQPQPNSPPAS